MKLNELRVGNLLSYNGEVFPVDCIQGDDTIRLLKGDTTIGCFGLNIKSIVPITLTEEWLFKLGFDRESNGKLCLRIANILIWCRTPAHFDGEHFGNNDISIILYNGYGSMYDNEVSLHHIKHVHQLQNIYYALTGNELKIK